MRRNPKFKHKFSLTSPRALALNKELSWGKVLVLATICSFNNIFMQITKHFIQGNKGWKGDQGPMGLPVSLAWTFFVSKRSMTIFHIRIIRNNSVSLHRAAALLTHHQVTEAFRLRNTRTNLKAWHAHSLLWGQVHLSNKSTDWIVSKWLIRSIYHLSVCTTKVPEHMHVLFKICILMLSTEYTIICTAHVQLKHERSK